MMPEKLSSEERTILLQLARQALEKGVRGEALPPLDIESLPPRLREPGATFVTLAKKGSYEVVLAPWRRANRWRKTCESMRLLLRFMIFAFLR